MIDEELKQMGYIEDLATGFLLLEKNEKNQQDAPFFNPKEKTAFLKALKIHGNQSKAAHDLGFPLAQIRFALAKDLKFREAFEETLLEMRHKLEGELYVAGLAGKSREAHLWLQTYFPDEFGTKKSQSPKKDKKNDTIDNLYNQSL